MHGRIGKSIVVVHRSFSSKVKGGHSGHSGEIARFHAALVDYKARLEKRRLAARAARTTAPNGATGPVERPFDTALPGDIAPATT
jgi:hypothetical protein